MSDGVADAAGMIGTGIGLGILTMGALIPIKIMKKSLEEVEKDEDEEPKKRKGQKGVVLPKVRVTPRKIPRKEAYEFDAKVMMPDIRINYPTMRGVKPFDIKKIKF